MTAGNRVTFSSIVFLVALTPLCAREPLNESRLKLVIPRIDYSSLSLRDGTVLIVGGIGASIE